VDSKEVRERVALLAALRRSSPKKLVEELGGDRFLRRLKREMRDKKVLAFLVQNAEISERTVSQGDAVRNEGRG
jgi:hypothetical protein